MEVGNGWGGVTAKDLSAVGLDLNEQGISDAYIRELMDRMEQSLHVEENVVVFLLPERARGLYMSETAIWTSCRLSLARRRDRCGRSGFPSTCATMRSTSSTRTIPSLRPSSATVSSPNCEWCCAIAIVESPRTGSRSPSATRCCALPICHSIRAMPRSCSTFSS